LDDQERSEQLLGVAMAMTRKQERGSVRIESHGTVGMHVEVLGRGERSGQSVREATT
jgi:hypothetical protein